MTLLTILSTVSVFVLFSNTAFGYPPSIADTSGSARPSLRALFLIDKNATEAWIRGDAKFFDDILSEKFVSHKDGMRIGKVDLVSMVRTSRCELKNSTFEEPRMSMIHADIYVVTYRATFEGSCSFPDGSSIRLLSPVRGASIYLRNGKRWQSVFHSETLVRDGKEVSGTQVPTSKKDTTKPPKEASTPPSPAAGPGGDENTAKLLDVHQSLMDAIGTKNRSRFEKVMATSISSVNPFGLWISGKKAVSDSWAGLKCEQVREVKVSDGVATKIAPNFELLTVKTSMDGRCGNQANRTTYQTAIYQKVRDAWKLSFLFESPAN